VAKRKSTGRSNNPKFATANKGQRAGQVKPLEGMNVGGNTDAQVRLNAWAQGSMLHKQLKSNKSTGMRWG